MKKIKKWGLISLASTLLASSALAHSAMEQEAIDLVKSLGNSANATYPNAYKSQSGGFISGGGLAMRGKARNYQIAEFTSPSFSAGCGGIDMHFGGFGFIDGDNIKQMINTILSNAGYFAAGIALQTISPQIKSVLDQAMHLLQSVNHMNINSCQAAAQLVGGIWPKTEASSQVLCSSIGVEKGTFKDWAAARQGCMLDSQRTKVISKRKEDNSSFKDQLGEEYNLAWKALERSNFSKEIKEIFMSISGTIISRKEGDGSTKVAYLPSLAYDDIWLRAVIDGLSDIRIYACPQNDPQCLRPTWNTTKLQTPLLKLILDIMEGIEKNMEQGQPLTANQKGLINMSRFPILKMMKVEKAVKRGQKVSEVLLYADLIASEIVIKYVEDVISLMQKYVRDMEITQLGDGFLAEFKGDLRLVREAMYKHKRLLAGHLDGILAAIQRTLEMEKQMYNGFNQQIKY